jgi:pyridoxal phosphate enzyme (YggS family)
MPIAEALKLAHENIKRAAARTGRDPDTVKLIAVSKTVDIRRIIEAIRAGVTILGENRVQEARDKIAELESKISPTASLTGKEGTGVEWHLIGSLQKNKAKTAVQLFDLIHSVDSADLANELNKCAFNKGKVQRILIQVKLSDEAAKHGVEENGVMTLLDNVMELDNLTPEGLMTIPPYFENPEESRPYFKRLRDIAGRAIEKGFPLKELSMGMSNDYEVAVEEGATMVRIGTFIFGERNY